VAEIETPGEISTPEPTENTEEPTTDAWLET
jgi:hypothetical protein